MANRVFFTDEAFFVGNGNKVLDANPAEGDIAVTSRVTGVNDYERFPDVLPEYRLDPADMDSSIPGVLIAPKGPTDMALTPPPGAPIGPMTLQAFAGQSVPAGGMLVFTVEAGDTKTAAQSNTTLGFLVNLATGQRTSRSGMPLFSLQVCHVSGFAMVLQAMQTQTTPDFNDVKNALTASAAGYSAANVQALLYSCPPLAGSLGAVGLVGMTPNTKTTPFFAQLVMPHDIIMFAITYPVGLQANAEADVKDYIDKSNIRIRTDLLVPKMLPPKFFKYTAGKWEPITPSMMPPAQVPVDPNDPTNLAMKPAFAQAEDMPYLDLSSLQPQVWDPTAGAWSPTGSAAYYKGTAGSSGVGGEAGWYKV